MSNKITIREVVLLAGMLEVDMSLQGAIKNSVTPLGSLATTAS